jgi:hypothetical protein
VQFFRRHFYITALTTRTRNLGDLLEENEMQLLMTKTAAVCTWDLEKYCEKNQILPNH